MILKRIIVSYANICLKEGIMLCIVLKINIFLTYLVLEYFLYFRENKVML
ncbi:hypothetical protein GCM10022395_27100 [Snuella lapsa]|uniref:Photosystem II protein I n=1 Tax=Snuella lapsa TaxID=870481 RepID=A0ABP6Y521_9FLAO